MTTNKPVLEPKHLIFYSSLFLILVLPILVDLANGMVYYVLRKEFSIGVMYRGAMTVILFPFLFYIKNRALQFYLFTIIFFFIICNVVWAYYASDYMFSTEIRTYSRFFLQFVGLGYLIFLVERFEIELELMMKMTVLYGIIGGCALLFSFFTGIGVATYGSEDLSYGVVSFFKSQNDIGLTILLTLPMAMYFFLKEFTFKWFLAIFIIVYSLFILSTRAGVMGSVGVLFVFIVIMNFYNKQQVGVPMVLKMFLIFLFLLSIVVGIPLYIQFLTQNPFMIHKYAIMIEDEGVRVDLITVARQVMSERNLILDLFGEGDYGFHTQMARILYGIGLIPEGGRRTEQDIFDFIGSYGYILGITILLFPVFCFFKILKAFFINRRLIDFAFTIVMLLFIFHSFTAGHALGSPTVAATMVLPYLYILEYRRFNPIYQK